MWARITTNVLSPEETPIGRFRTESLDTLVPLETRASPKNDVQPFARIGLRRFAIRILQPKYVDSVETFTLCTITWAWASLPFAA